MSTVEKECNFEYCHLLLAAGSLADEASLAVKKSVQCKYSAP